MANPKIAETLKTPEVSKEGVKRKGSVDAPATTDLKKVKEEDPEVDTTIMEPEHQPEISYGPSNPATKYKYNEPRTDSVNTKFTQPYLAKLSRALILHLCDSCNKAAESYLPRVTHQGLPCFVQPMCVGCIYVNRRCSQNVFFNIHLKNQHDKQLNKPYPELGNDDIGV